MITFRQFLETRQSLIVARPTNFLPKANMSVVNAPGRGGESFYSRSAVRPVTMSKDPVAKPVMFQGTSRLGYSPNRGVGNSGSVNSPTYQPKKFRPPKP